MAKWEGKLNKYVGNSWFSISTYVDTGMKLHRVNQLQTRFLDVFIRGEKVVLGKDTEVLLCQL